MSISSYLYGHNVIRSVTPCHFPLEVEHDPAVVGKAKNTPIEGAYYLDSPARHAERLCEKAISVDP